MIKPPMGYVAPSTRRTESAYDAEAARLQWARELREADLRSLAADYLRGSRSPEVVDAFAEYERRFPEELLQKKQKGKKRSK